MWRDAMIEEHVETNPFALLQWPRQPRKRPDPYTVEERDRILKWWEENDFFFFPYVYFQFHTGCRPSETAALEQDDLRLDDAMISINGSLVMGIEGATQDRRRRPANSRWPGYCRNHQDSAVARAGHKARLCWQARQPNDEEMGGAQLAKMLGCPRHSIPKVQRNSAHIYY
jgi:integrase